MENENSKLQYKCANPDCFNFITLGLFCSTACAIKYGAHDGSEWIMSDKDLNKIKRIFKDE